MKIYEIGTPVQISYPYFVLKSVWDIYTDQYGIITESTPDHAKVSVITLSTEKALDPLIVYADESLVPLLRFPADFEDLREGDFVQNIAVDNSWAVIKVFLYEEGLNHNPHGVFYRLLKKEEIRPLPNQIGQEISITINSETSNYIKVSKDNWMLKEKYTFISSRDLEEILFLNNIQYTQPTQPQPSTS